MKVPTAATALGERWREQNLPTKNMPHNGVDRLRGRGFPWRVGHAACRQCAISSPSSVE
jgi:hypothetical protein